MNNHLYTSYKGNNDILLNEISKLYFNPGDKIADVTYGNGAFWKMMDMSNYNFHPSDLVTVPGASYDFTDLPYGDSSFDVVVFDPPYIPFPRKNTRHYESCYRNTETTDKFNQDDIMELYRAGIVEAKRILKPKGLLLVKCKDIKVGTKQRWAHIEINTMADKIGLTSIDLFVLTPFSTPIINPKLNQRSARKNHSYMWLFKNNS